MQVREQLIAPDLSLLTLPNHAPLFDDEVAIGDQLGEREILFNHDERRSGRSGLSDRGDHVFDVLPLHTSLGSSSSSTGCASDRPRTNDRILFLGRPISTKKWSASVRTSLMSCSITTMVAPRRSLAQRITSITCAVSCAATHERQSVNARRIHRP
jgi:hypothetical protein